MDGLRQYLLTMVVAAVLCAVATTILPEKAGNLRRMKLICGFFLLAVACRPLGGGVPSLDTGVLEDCRADAQQVHDAAREATDDAMEEVIIQKTAAYIEDKAESLGAVVHAAVTLNRDMLPWQVELTGEVSPYVRIRLAQSISSELDIPEERQVWMP